MEVHWWLNKHFITYHYYSVFILIMQLCSIISSLIIMLWNNWTGANTPLFPSKEWWSWIIKLWKVLENYLYSADKGSYKMIPCWWLITKSFFPHHILDMLTNRKKITPLITRCHSNSSLSAVILDVVVIWGICSETAQSVCDQKDILKQNKQTNKPKYWDGGCWEKRDTFFR